MVQLGVLATRYCSLKPFQSTQCLYLSIFAPLKATDVRPSTVMPSEPLPVLFYMHGGCYENGGSNEERLNGTYFIQRTGQKVLVVVVNYRLSIFGFLGGDALRDAGAGGTTGNWGMLDQRLALEWTYNHISAFGGDPNNIMIFGESAGAGSVANHLVRPASMNYYKRAAAQSGAFAEWIANPGQWAQAQYDKLLSITGCKDPSCLRALDADALKKAGPEAGYVPSPVPLEGFPSQLRCVWAPVVDGVELKAHPATLARQGQHANVPFLLGTNRDEGASFMGGRTPRKATAADLQKYLTQDLQLNQTVAGAALKLYNPDSFNDTDCCSRYFWAATQMLGDLTMTCAALDAATWWKQAGGASAVYKYYFTHAHAGSPFVSHASDIPYVWHVDPLLDPQAGGTLVSDHMNAYWSNFASTSDPMKGPQASADLPQWPEFQAGNKVTLHIGDSSFPAPSHETRCAFWGSVGYLPK